MPFARGTHLSPCPSLTLVHVYTCTPASGADLVPRAETIIKADLKLGSGTLPVATISEDIIRLCTFPHLKFSAEGAAVQLRSLHINSDLASLATVHPLSLPHTHQWIRSQHRAPSTPYGIWSTRRAQAPQKHRTIHSYPGRGLSECYNLRNIS